MIDPIITAIYLIAALAICRADFLLCVSAWCINTYFINVSSDLSAVYSFACFGFAYIILAMLLSGRHGFFAALIALYHFVFATDTWINAETETWIWHNHEVFVLILHVCLIVSFSGLFWQLVDTWVSYLSRFRAMLSGNSDNICNQDCGVNQDQIK